MADSFIPNLSPRPAQIVDLSNRAIPEPRELAAVERVMQIVQRAAKQAFGSKAEAALFGSRMTGLALAESDVDIVVLGEGFDPLDRPAHLPRLDIWTLLDGPCRDQSYKAPNASQRL